ncbi:MAG: hypothetical protein LBS20_09520 [Prevotella sp.]|jgi:hypothetical protein|nr:hypothetical protein [Prevotella sp.]
MNNKINKADLISAVLMANWLRVIMVLAIIIGIIETCIVDDVDPIDNSINKDREVVENVIVTDSTHNGFRVVYATKNKVTRERLEEIKSRPHIQDAFKRLKKDAPVHFGSLLTTDIYDFAEFAIHYDIDPDIHIHNIFVEGYEKCKLYIGHNPGIENPAVFFNTGTEQGAQYISHKDIYYRRRKEERIYRYWKCYGIHATSCDDERYSHFSESERIW